MRIFLGFGDAQLGEPGGGDDLAQGFDGHVGREKRGEEGVQLVRIFDHAHGLGESHLAGAGEAVEGRVEQSGEHLACAVGAEIGHHQPVAVPHARIIAKRGGEDEFVGFVFGVGRLHDIRRLVRARSCRIHQRIIGQLHAFPTLVAVHAVITTADGGDVGIFSARNVALELRQIFQGAFRRGVAPIEEGMNAHGHAHAVEDFCHRRDLALMGMDAAGREQPEQMADASGFFEFVCKLLQCGIGGERAVRNGRIDARQILHHHPAGADVHVPDFGIAHLPLG